MVKKENPSVKYKQNIVIVPFVIVVLFIVLLSLLLIRLFLFTLPLPPSLHRFSILDCSYYLVAFHEWLCWWLCYTLLVLQTKQVLYSCLRICLYRSCSFLNLNFAFLTKVVVVEILDENRNQ